MNFTCQKRLFYEALQSVSHAVASRSTLPILGHVLLEAREGQLKLITTDLEISLACTLPLDGGEEGAVTVPQRIIQDVVGNLPDAELTITADERNLLTVSAAKSQYTIHGLPSAEYPMLPQVTSDTRLSLPGALLRDLIRKTLFAAGTDESRVTLTGCLFACDGQMVTMAATDTHRLALKRVPVSGQIEAPVSVIIPARALQEVLRMVGNSEEPVDIMVSENKILFTAGRVQLISRLIEGQFPAYERVIPAETHKRMVANRQQLFEAVRRASIVARTESNKIVMRSQDSTLTISAETGEVGKAYEEIPISLEGEPVQIAFNAAYLHDVLAVLDTETVEFGLTGPLNPGLIKADGEAEYQYVVMPMQML